MLHFQKLALELKCPLYLRLFKNPIFLPCNHLFCSSCMSDSSTIGSECALCNTKYTQIDLRHVPFVENMVTIYKNLDATFCANAFQQCSSDDMMVLERCQTLQNSICSNKNTDKVMLNSCMSNEVGAANRIVEKSDSMRCSQKDIGDRVEIDLNQATESAPDSPPFCDKGYDNCCSYQDSEQPPNVVKSEYSSLKSTTTEKSDLKERMAQFRSENEGLRGDTKKHKNLPNGDAIIQQSTSYHNKLVDSRRDLDLKSEKVPGAIISSNSPNDSCPSTSMCSFCQSFDISEATGPMLHYEEGILVTGDAAMQPNVVHVHKVCIDWAPQVYFVGETVKNLKKEVARGAKLKCTLCGLKGAALGCFVKSCKRTYHVPCEMNISTCRWDHVNYLLLCPSHSNVKFPSENSSHKKKSTQKHHVSSQLPLQQPNNLLGGLRNDDKKFVFCGSALSNEEKVLLINFASKVGATVTKCWTSNVTHVIAATDANGACSRTMKVLRAILNGQWILKVDWIRACMEETNLVDEECYEINLILEDALDGGQVAAFSAIEIITGLVKLLHSVNGSKWQNTFLGLWTAALRLVQRERDSKAGPIPRLDTCMCLLLSITTHVVANIVEEEESELIEEAERGPSNQGKSKQVLGKRRGELITSLLLLGNSQCLLIPPQTALVEGLRACCLVKSVVEDRWWPFIKTKIPKPIQYPVAENGFEFQESLIEALYGLSIWDRLQALVTILKMLTEQNKKEK